MNAWDDLRNQIDELYRRENVAVPDLAAGVPSPLPQTALPDALTSLYAAEDTLFASFGIGRTAQTLAELNSAFAASKPGETVYVIGKIKADASAYFVTPAGVRVCSAKGETPGWLVGSVMPAGGTPDQWTEISNLKITHDDDQKGIAGAGIYAIGKNVRLLANDISNCWDSLIALFQQGESLVAENVLHKPRRGHGEYTHHANSNGQINTVVRNIGWDFPNTADDHKYFMQFFSASNPGNPAQDYIVEDNYGIGYLNIGSQFAPTSNFKARRNFISGFLRIGWKSAQNIDLEFSDNDVYAGTQDVPVSNFQTITSPIPNYHNGSGAVVYSSAPAIDFSGTQKPYRMVKTQFHNDIIAFGVQTPVNKNAIIDVSGLGLTVGKRYNIYAPQFITDKLVLLTTFVYSEGFYPVLKPTTYPILFELKAV